MEKANFGQIVSFLFGIANDCLVDTYDVGDYRKIILPMMVIRRFDAVLEPTKEKVLKMKEQLDAAGITDQDEALCSVAGEAFCNSSPYTLSDLKSRTNQQQLKSDFILYLNGFSQNVQDIIKRFEFRNQIDKLSEHDILGLLISKFTDSSVNLSNRPIYDAKGNLVQPALDNHTMGTVFEEVIRKFNEETNITDAGRHFTPRDIVELITDLAFVPVKGKIQSTTYRIYDGACGTGGMLTVAEGRMQEMAKEFGKNVSIHLYGQENSDETYAIARSDMLVKGEGVQANNIFFGSTISNDGFSGETFDFMLSNPPFGTPWKTDLKAWGDIKKDEITDTRFRVNYKGEDFSLIPDIGDPQMLFLANNISKMKKNTVLGSRIVEVHNSSSLSTGKAGSGPSNLRQYIIEQDMLEAIVALPEEMFYNTPITTYIWVLTNKKDVKRKGKVQLIDATKIKTSLRKNLGNKKFEISKELRSKILDIYMGFDQADSKLSKIVDNSDFGYWEVPIMHPLYDENGKIVVETKGKNKGKPKADKDLTDKNRVQFSYAGGVEAFYSEEVKPYSPDAWIDWDNIKIGYDISFTKYFYDPEDLRDALDIVSDLNNIHSESTQTLEKIIEHAKGNAVLQTTNMKDSGNKWLGKIPAHWDLVYLWQICAEQKNKNSQNQENNVLSLSHGNIIRKKDLNYTLVNSNGYEQGITTEYNKQYAIDEDRLFRFLMSTQKKAMDELHILDSDLEKDRFFKQLDKKLKSDGVIELLRKGLRYKHLRLDLFYVRPSVHNPEAAALYEKNIFSVTRQLQYSSFNPRLALDVCAFINGLPVITMELKNQLTKQNVFDAVEQYKNDRTPDEVLFSFKRCIVHFAVDDNEIRMCTELKGKKSWFLPFKLFCVYRNTEE